MNKLTTAMRRLLLLTALLCVAVTTVNAQIKEEKFKRDIIEPWDLLGGPKVGVSASNLSELDGKTVIGPVIGGFIQAYVNENFSISGEVTFNHRGSNDAKVVVDHKETIIHEDGTETTVSENIGQPRDISLNYLDISFLTRWYPVKKVPVNVYTGLALSRIVSTKLNGGTKDLDIEDDIRKQDIAIPVGVGLELNNWIVDLRYNYGLAKLPDSDLAKNSFDGKSPRNSSISLTVGYRFLFW